jgi:fructosamine-3-kinase
VSALKLADRARWRPVGGGSICRVWRAETVDGRAVIVKKAPYDVAVEADGLAALAHAGAPVPGVLAAEGDRLVLEAVGGPPDWDALGEAVAHTHAVTASAYGWHRDNLIGELVQPNAWHADWPAFFYAQRIAPFLDAPGLPGDLRTRLQRAGSGPLARLLPARPPASLIHGDLWAGNVVEGRWLIDPAVNHADRELELAFAALFGGLPPAFWQAYQRVWPLPAGWRERRPALQLYHLLVHVAHFGSGWAGGVADRLDALGW